MDRQQPYNYEPVDEPIILDKEEYTEDQWKTLLCIFCCAKNTERLKLNMRSIEYWRNFNE